MNQRVISAMLLACLLLIAIFAAGQTSPITTDVLGVHDLSSGASPLHGANANACIYCHAPHNASSSRLWNQRLSTQQYLLNPGSTGGVTTQTSVSPSSMLCLSCHDGSVAVGQTIGTGTLTMIGALSNNMGNKLQGSHPFSIQPQLTDASSLVATLAASHTTKDPAVSLIGNNVECSTCHDVHNQYKDMRNRKFLVRDNTTSPLCFACHDVGARTVGGRDNPLTTWPNSVHAKSTAAVAPKAGLGSYNNIAEFACSTCHTSHGALSTSLLRNNPNRAAIPTADDTSQACLTCHDGSDNLVVPILNVLGDMQTAGQFAHPFADTSNQHAASESVVLDRNRHTTCADCHASHAAQPTTAFVGTPNIRPSQTGVSGVTADGTVTKAATYQFENCLRCHATSVDKAALAAFGYMPARAMFSGDTLDVSLQFAHGATSSHPVMRDATNLARPSLLKNMWDVTFELQSRAMSSRILCTDCHNSDKNREFGGTGPNGPHGSKNEHILERQYIISKVGPGALPGTNIVNLNPSPILTAIPTAPYALCAKCHDLNNIVSNVTFSQHSRHINDGFSCSVCHSAHGVPAGTTGVTGVGLVTFDLNVVTSSNNKPISYNGGGSCTLTCHAHEHNK